MPLIPDFIKRDSVLADVPGIRYIPDFISDDEEREILRAVDASPWLADLKRRVQHYGYRYDYEKRHVSLNDYIGPLPDWTQAVTNRLVESGIFTAAPDQLIVNEYRPGQGIAPHVDRESCFGPTVASISLAAPITMDLLNGDQHLQLRLLQRSLLILTGPARSLWRHGIAARSRDIVDGIPQRRQRRVSLTYRTVIPEAPRS